MSFDFEAPIPDQAMALLRRLIQVEDWARQGDPRAQPYLDADAVRIVDGRAEFHRTRFIHVLTEQLVNEKMAPVDRIIELTKQAFRKEEGA